MDGYAVENTCTGNQELEKNYRDEGNSTSGEGMKEEESTMEVFNSVELDLACCSEKLVNLHILLTHLLAWDNDLDIMAIETGNISATSIEKALVFDNLSEILDSELKEVENFIENIEAGIVDARDKISSCRHLPELFATMEEKLHNSEELLNKSQEQILEVQMQSAKLQMAWSAFRLENWKGDKAMELSANGQLSNSDANSRKQTAEQQRHILRKLEKFHAIEMDLEKKLYELRQNEEQMKLKLHYTQQVAFHMEEAVEVVWGRFLEAENAAEVLMGISKELIGQLQIVQFNLNGSFEREAELKSKLQDCMLQLGAKDTTVNKLENSIAEHMTKSSEVPILREKVKSLEEQLKKSESRLKNVNAFNEELQEQHSEMENLVESLHESIHEAEGRVKTAEAKVEQLTDTNLELTEEVNFLKDSRDSNTKKVNLLEQELRELEIQLQHAKASSEASQEQQNMLYSAIWDMETLIEDLKSKVSRAESKTESAEEQCITLSETNLELDKELSFLGSRVKALETALDDANNSKAAIAKEINLKTRLIMDTVMQLARERECIQNQLFLLTKENGILVEKLKNAKRNATATVYQNGDCDDKDLLSENDSCNGSCGKAFEEAMSSSKSFQADKSPEDVPLHVTEVGTSNSILDGAEMVPKLEIVRTEQAGQLKHTYFVKAIFVALSAAIIYLLHKKPAPFDNF